MKHFPETIPGFVAGALYLHCILQNFLSQVSSPKPVQYQPLSKRSTTTLGYNTLRQLCTWIKHVGEYTKLLVQLPIYNHGHLLSNQGALSAVPGNAMGWAWNYLRENCVSYEPSHGLSPNRDTAWFDKLAAMNYLSRCNLFNSWQLVQYVEFSQRSLVPQTLIQTVPWYLTIWRKPKTRYRMSRKEKIKYSPLVPVKYFILRLIGPTQWLN